ncbi:E3 ubiquitin-protein ligase E3D isoform X10 [Macaca fascicularis]|uniref:E3 ubiquitin-protein ligase E3D isoform X10 n=1 Tax=Macaca fascicularis TaxID=9541 RepID=UPI0032B04104
MAATAAETRIFLEVRRQLQSALLILGKLLRVLPLPSENWEALVGEWCCHPDPFANKPLHPQENDCFIGDSFFLVNLRTSLWQPRPELSPVEMCCVSSDNHCKLEPKANTKVICKRCKVMLGETMSSETTKFYMTEIIIQSSERSFPIIPRSRFVQSVITQCLVQLSSARSTFRFRIQGQDDKVYILLWLLNSDSLVIESLRNSKYIKKFPLLEDTLKADSSSAWSAIKVLYQPCIKSRNERLVSLWESDISVHPLTLPSATCLELLLILSRSNANLPSSLRHMNSFQIHQRKCQMVLFDSLVSCITYFYHVEATISLSLMSSFREQQPSNMGAV